MRCEIAILNCAINLFENVGAAYQRVAILNFHCKKKKKYIFKSEKNICCMSSSMNIRTITGIKIADII